jgi:adenylate kinase family enzyme
MHLDLDYHDKKHDYEHDREAWIKRVEKLTAEPEWIIDGNYRSTFPLRFDRADTIIFMDFRRWRAMKGIFARRFEYRNKLRDDMPEGWIEKIPRDFFMFVWNFNKKYRSDIVDSLNSDHYKKVIIFHRPADAERYLKQL